MCVGERLLCGEKKKRNGKAMRWCVCARWSCLYYYCMIFGVPDAMNLFCIIIFVASIRFNFVIIVFDRALNTSSIFSKNYRIFNFMRWIHFEMCLHSSKKGDANYNVFNVNDLRIPNSFLDVRHPTLPTHCTPIHRHTPSISCTRRHLAIFLLWIISLTHWLIHKHLSFYHFDN